MKLLLSIWAFTVATGLNFAGQNTPIYLPPHLATHAEQLYPLTFTAKTPGAIYFDTTCRFSTLQQPRIAIDHAGACTIPILFHLDKIAGSTVVTAKLIDTKGQTNQTLRFTVYPTLVRTPYWKQCQDGNFTIDSTTGAPLQITALQGAVVNTKSGFRITGRLIGTQAQITLKNIGQVMLP